MKIRIQNNSIRFRLSQTEVRDYGREGACMGKTEFADANTLMYRLAQSSEFGATFNNKVITISLPEEEVKSWIASDQVSICGELSLENEDILSILVEKDFKCLTERNEDESDLFPNPNEENC